MTASFLALERAARSDELFLAVAVLLDELEFLGALGEGDRIGQLRAQIHAVARLRAAMWAQQPEITLLDLYARTLALTELDEVRARWVTALDTRGPWLRPLSAWQPELGEVAELRSSATMPFDELAELYFVSEDEVALHGSGDPLVWSWASGCIGLRADLDPPPPEDPQAMDPRFERRDGGGLVFRPTPRAEARMLPGSDQFMYPPSARVSADGRRIFLWGDTWYDLGGVKIIDASSLEVLGDHDLDPVSTVVERPGSDELLVQSDRGLTIVGRDPPWSGPHRGSFAWSPSGRYVCNVSGYLAQIVDTHVPLRPRGAGGLPPTFSPNGTRLVNDAVLLDGRTGTIIAPLDVHTGPYDHGGPPSPWLHVGTELVICIYGRDVELWNTQTGEQVMLDEHISLWGDVAAYSCSGRRFAFGPSEPEIPVQVYALPSGELITEFVFDFDIERLALSSTGELVAAYGEGRIEVRELDGTLRCEGRTRGPQDRRRRSLWEGELRFFDDDRRLLVHEAGSSIRPALACAWDIETNPATRLDPELAPVETALPGWTIESGTTSIFTHPSGARIVVPSDGPWSANPCAPNILACPGGMFELRGHA